MAVCLMKTHRPQAAKMRSLSFFSAALAVSGVTVASPLSTRDLVTCPKPDPDHLNLVPDARYPTISVTTSPPETWQQRPGTGLCSFNTTQARKQLDDAIQEATLHPCDQKVQVPYDNHGAVEPGAKPLVGLMVLGGDVTRKVPTYANLLQFMTLAENLLPTTDTSDCIELIQYLGSPVIFGRFAVSG